MALTRLRSTKEQLSLRSGGKSVMRLPARLEVWFLAIAGIPALLRGQSLAPPPLGAAASFAVLGGSSVKNSGPTIVTGNLGVSPGNTVTGFPPGTVKVGDPFRNDST